MAWPVFHVPVVLVRRKFRGWVFGVLSLVFLAQMSNMADFVNWHWVG